MQQYRDGSASHPLLWQPSLEPPIPLEADGAGPYREPAGWSVTSSEAPGGRTGDTGRQREEGLAPSGTPSIPSFQLRNFLANQGAREEDARRQKLSAVDVEGAAVMAHWRPFRAALTGRFSSADCIQISPVRIFSSFGSQSSPSGTIQMDRE